MSKTKNFTKINQQITSKEIRLIDITGKMVGVVPIEKALMLAHDAGLDLVEISPQNYPPVCKILDYGKYRYEIKKKSQKTKKKQKTVTIKEVKLKLNIAQGDLDVKIKNIKRFIEEEYKIKITLQFKGREFSHQDLGYILLEKIIQKLSDIIKVELGPKIEGQSMILILIPQK